MKILIFTTFILTFNSWAYEELCPTVKIKKLKNLKLTNNEEHLLCGINEQQGYESIPVYQAKYHMQGFLQSRGYLKPEMKIEDGILYVDRGEKAQVKKIYVKGEDPKLVTQTETELRHLYNRRELATATLNSIEAEALAQIRKRGHPCSEVQAVADIDTNNVNLELKRLQLHIFGVVEREEIEGLRENALDRFYPFEASDQFNADLLRLTEKRMIRSDVVQATYFMEKCQGQNFELSQNFISGPPRNIRYGVGASTELGPMARVRWAHNRFKSMASQMTATAQTSFRSQSLTLTADSYLWHHEPRRSIFSEAELLREKQVGYELLVYRLRPSMKWTRDAEGFNKLYRLGPAYEGGTFSADDHTATRSFSSGALEGVAQWMSHKYEFFDILPQAGQIYTFNFDFRHPVAGFGASLLKLETSSAHIHPMSNWGRGELVGAARLNLGTSVVNTDKLSLDTMPPTVKFFGGGSDDIRGFFLRTLPENGGLGALTKASVKLELRRTYLWKESLEAFAFVDGGYFGVESWTLDDELFYSPGLGLRWLSPIGLIQGYWARALTASPNDDKGNFFYAGIGGTF